ncbi:Hypothetical predicted protein [Paramuricea clavata]|uniref:Uncharacterized protein n=1 Tax=Paramuricea clavata TaxID=317549 RepID=A0A6S7KN90_PARCT|nr:Hypothetical predicted protein [Paramuricea clavata]
MPRFNIGKYRRKRKQMEEKKLEQKVQSSRQIIQIETEIVEREIVLAKKRKQSHAMDEKLRNLDATVENIVSQIEDLEDIKQELRQPDKKSRASQLSEKALQSRKDNPTGFENGKITLTTPNARMRRKETFMVAQEIHGGSSESSVPGAVALVDTALNKCSSNVLVDVMSANKKFTKHVMPSIYKGNLKAYESSEENMIRSVSVYYCGGIAGNIYSVYDTLCDDLDKDDKVCGCYRSLKELLLRLAEFYLSGKSGYTLTWFGEEYTFLITLGGDGAPFGKDDTATAWLDGPEGEVTVNVKFCVAELPNDMKMVVFLSGELSNSAKHFSSFADVSNDSANEVKGTFGVKENNTWHPWEYSSRLTVVKKVEGLKKTLSKEKSADRTKRSKITSLIAKLKSRQEFIPVLGPIVDRIRIEPLHLKNNACALAHRYLLDEWREFSGDVLGFALLVV